MKQPAGWKSDPLRDAEARIRALTHEVGSLREDLRRETKRRERAVARSKECDAAQVQASERIQQLEFLKTKLTQQLESSESTARQTNDKNKQTLAALKHGLSQVEAAVAQRFKSGQQHVQEAFVVLQKLQRLLFCPHPGLNGASPLASQITLEAQHNLEQLTHCLSHLGGLLAGGLEGALSSPRLQRPGSSSPSSNDRQDQQCVARPETSEELGDVRDIAQQQNEHLAAVRTMQGELHRYQDEVQMLKQHVEDLAAKLSTAEQQKAALQEQVSALQNTTVGTSGLQQQVQQVTAALGEAEKQKAELQQRNESLHHQLAELSRTYNELVATAQHHQQRAETESSARSKAEAAHVQLQQHVSKLQESCRTSEKSVSSLQAALESLQVALSERDKQISQQRARISHLESQLLEQQADIRHALNLVSNRKASSLRHSYLAAYPTSLRPASADLVHTIPTTSSPYLSASALTSSSAHHYTHPRPHTLSPTTLPQLPSLHQLHHPTSTHYILPAHASASTSKAPQHTTHPVQPIPAQILLHHVPNSQPTGPTASPSTSLPPSAVAQAFHSLSTSTYTDIPATTSPPAPAVTTSHCATTLQPGAAQPPARSMHPATAADENSPPVSASSGHTHQPQSQTTYTAAESTHGQAIAVVQTQVSSATAVSLSPSTDADPRYIGKLKQDMLDLDSEIAELEASLKAATLRLT